MFGNVALAHGPHYNQVQEVTWEQIDCEIVLKSIISMVNGLANAIGEREARAALREAGHSAAVNLLEALGFAQSYSQVDGNHVQMQGNVISDALTALGVDADRHPARYSAYGILEGFVHVSHERITIVGRQNNEPREVWMVQFAASGKGAPSPAYSAALTESTLAS